MKKLVLMITTILLFTSCLSYFMNGALKHMGIYDEEVGLVEFLSDETDRKVIFAPIHHLGTENFYTDLGSKIKAHKNDGFKILYEQVFTGIKDDTIKLKEYIRKFELISGVNVISNGGYAQDLKNSVHLDRFKPKKKLIGQPPYSRMNVDSLKDVRADMNLEEIVDRYEKEFGVINLCDSGALENCTNEKVDKKIYQKIVLDWRNDRIIDYVFSDSLKAKDVFIVYGSAHLLGVKERLATKGFVNKSTESN